MSDDIRKRAFDLYRAPFRFEGGYIWDGKGEMVADSRIDSDIGPRVRGWGRMSYLPDTAALYEATGHLIAQAMTEFWRREGKGRERR